MSITYEPREGEKLVDDRYKLWENPQTARFRYTLIDIESTDHEAWIEANDVEDLTEMR